MTISVTTLISYGLAESFQPLKYAIRYNLYLKTPSIEYLISGSDDNWWF